MARRFRSSLEGQLAWLLTLLVLLAVTIGAACAYWLDDPWVGYLVALAISVPIVLYLLHRKMAPVNRLIQAIADGLAGLRDGDFSHSIARLRDDELDGVVEQFNAVGEVLRRERQDLFQRELLLDSVIQSSPLALVLVNDRGQIIYANTTARHQFHAGRPLEGHRLETVMQEVPVEFQEAVRAGLDGLFTVEAEPEPETWHLSRNQFVLNGRNHELYLFKQLTRELNRQEVVTWKKVIRVISHELNNSLAPISSLAHSGLIVAGESDNQRLQRIFGTIEDRTRHLKQFIDGYARFAKLPAPRPEPVHWREFVDGLRQVVDFELHSTLPDSACHFDPAQMEQVLLNLLKNARESGSPPGTVELLVGEAAQGLRKGLRILVRDRGVGMADEVLRNALLPFYSTKQAGTGLGLPLCREIVEAHGGRLSLHNREGGGLEIAIWLPAMPDTGPG